MMRSRPKLKMSDFQCQDGDLISKTESHQYLEIFRMSRPKLIMTEKFLGCQHQDTSRLGNMLDKETETSQDWEKMSIPGLHRDFC